MATAAVTPRVGVSEDWPTVFVGFGLIFLTLAGLRPALTLAGLRPALASFSWDTSTIGRAFPAFFVLSWLALLLEGAPFLQAWGFEYVIFSLLSGLAISNTVGVPAWLAEAVRTAYYIKTGLVLMGATILFGGVGMEGGVLLPAPSL